MCGWQVTRATNQCTVHQETPTLGNGAFPSLPLVSCPLPVSLKPYTHPNPHVYKHALFSWLCPLTTRYQTRAEKCDSLLLTRTVSMIELTHHRYPLLRYL